LSLLEGHAEPSPGGLRRSGWIAWLLGVATAAAFGVHVIRHPPRVRCSANARLDRAARAVVEVRPRRRGVLVIRSGDATVVVPRALQFDRQQALRLALELEDMLRGRGPAPSRPTAPLQNVRAQAEELLAGLLAVEPYRARLVLYSLGWPWSEGHVGRPSGGPSFVGPAASADALAPLRWLPDAVLLQLLERARAAPAWPVVEAELGASWGLSAEQTGALRALLCRQAVGGAFASDRGKEDACEALGKFADLAPAQCDAVLAMAGALELVRAGGEGISALRVMAEASPVLGEPLLRYALRKGGAARARPSD